MKRCFTITIIALLSLRAQAQLPVQKVLGAAGDFYKNTQSSLSFTVGEVSVQSYTTTNNILTEGFQQPFPTGALPLELLSFSATLVNKQTQLQWVTAQEINTRYFEIQRSSDARVFSKLQMVNSAGNSSQSHTYSAIDPDPIAGIDYYRLKEVDQDGRFTFSPIVYVSVLQGLNCMVYPNPASNQVQILVNSSLKTKVVITLMDFTGKVLSSRPAEIVPGPNLFKWNLADLASGIYIFRFSGTLLPDIKIIKQ